jgi:hypothetical protein
MIAAINPIENWGTRRKQSPGRHTDVPALASYGPGETRVKLPNGGGHRLKTPDLLLA